VIEQFMEFNIAICGAYKQHQSLTSSILKMKFASGFVLLFLPLFSFSQVWKKGGDFNQAPFYKRPGSVHLHLNNYMFSARKTATPPLNFIAQVTIVKNVSAGPMFTYFQFRESEFEAVNSTRWVNPEIRYHKMMVGLKAEYHINALIERIIRRPIPQHFVDVYTGGWIGYSFVKPNSVKAEEELVATNEKIRGGVSLGARSLVLKWMGFSLEGGYSSYGYCSFGLFFVAR